MSIVEKRVVELPTTRHSLLQRVKNPRDGEAWSEFVKTYRPAVYRFARRKGLQPADAEDLTQRVFTKASEKLKDWESRSERGSFRAWILLVTRNAVINVLARRPIDEPGHQQDGDVDEIAVTAGMDEQIEQEFRRATFRRVVGLIRDEFQASTWNAFWADRR